VAHLGGSHAGGSVVYGKRLKVRLAAKRVPSAVERWIRFYEDVRLDGETFNDFVSRVGEAELEARVKDLAMPIEFGLETLDNFMDWSRHEPYRVIRGEGECAL
jgi:hypothetical protein